MTAPVFTTEQLPVGDPSSVATAVDRWLRSPAMTALLDAFGCAPAPGLSVARRLAEVESFTARRWDYRKGLERHQATVEVFGPELDRLVRAAATALGLLGSRPPAHRDYDHLLVLGGGVNTMLARADHAASIVRAGTGAGAIAGLGSIRPLTGQVESARRAGLPECPTEGDAVDAALQRAFPLGAATGERSGVTETGAPWWLRSYRLAKTPVHVLAAPSTRPGQRANTADTLTGWAGLLRPKLAGARLLLVTTDIFVPFQHCDAVRLLALPHGCVIDTIGFSTSANPWVPAPRTHEILQEIRSAVRSMQALHTALT